MSDVPPPAPLLDISPEPTPDELAAISVAILAVAAAPGPNGGPDPEPSAWRTAALREGALGSAGGAPAGWCRPRPGWRA